MMFCEIWKHSRECQGGGGELLISLKVVGSQWMCWDVSQNNPRHLENRARNTFQKAILSIIPVLLAGTDLNQTLPGKAYSNLFQKRHWWRVHQFSTGIWLPTAYIRKLLTTLNLNFTCSNHPPRLLSVPPPTDTKEGLVL